MRSLLMMLLLLLRLPALLLASQGPWQPLHADDEDVVDGLPVVMVVECGLYGMMSM